MPPYDSSALPTMTSERNAGIGRGLFVGTCLPEIQEEQCSPDCVVSGTIHRKNFIECGILRRGVGVQAEEDYLHSSGDQLPAKANRRRKMAVCRPDLELPTGLHTSDMLPAYYGN